MDMRDQVKKALGLERPWPPRRLSLALQGGGSFGAFTWGVLDRLLEEPLIEFDMVSGASAGSVNAVLLASGLAQGDRASTRAKLEAFWRRVSDLAPVMPFSGNAVLGGGTLSFWTRVLSPYQFNPLELNPLRMALKEFVDFEEIRERSPIRLMLAATRVRDARLRLFAAHEATPDVVLASACLPLMHHTVMVDGDAYWDGGYAANPPLLPLVAETSALDILVVQITPAKAAEVPTSAPDIIRRIEQINFGASLRTEIEALSRYSELCGGVWGLLSKHGRKQRNLRLHRVAAEDKVDRLADASAANLEWSFLTSLRDQGRDAAAVWLGNEKAMSRPLRTETARRNLRKVA